MARETSKTIFEWGRDTFGPVTDHNRVIERARLEFDELAEAVREGHGVDDIVAEAADVVILLNRLAGIHGRDLAADRMPSPVDDAHPAACNGREDLIGPELRRRCGRWLVEHGAGQHTATPGGRVKQARPSP